MPPCASWESLIILAILCVLFLATDANLGTQRLRIQFQVWTLSEQVLNPPGKAGWWVSFTTNSSVLSKCVSFLLLLRWASVNTVALDNEIQCSLFCRSDRQTMQVSLGENPSVHRAQFLLKALERSFSQVLESAYIPWFMALSSIFKNTDIPLANFFFWGHCSLQTDCKWSPP